MNCPKCNSTKTKPVTRFREYLCLVYRTCHTCGYTGASLCFFGKQPQFQKITIPFVNRIYPKLF